MSDRIHTATPILADEAVKLAWATTTTELVTNEVGGAQIEYPRGTRFLIPRGQCPRQVRDTRFLKGIDLANKHVWLPLTHIEKVTTPDHVPVKTPTTAVAAMA